MHRFACVVLVDSRGWLLLQERDEHPTIDPECWSFVDGHVDEGEEFEPAAYRELEEETGVVLTPGSLSLWLDTTLSHVATGAEGAMQVWVAPTDLTDADIVVGEGRQIVFVDPVRVRDLNLGVSASLILPEFLDSPDYRELAAR